MPRDISKTEKVMPATPTPPAAGLPPEPLTPIPKPESEPVKPVTPEKVFIGLNPETLYGIKQGVENLKSSKKEIIRERIEINKKYDEILSKVSEIEGRVEEMSKTFLSFKQELKDTFIDEAKKSLSKDLKNLNNGIDALQERLIALEDDFIKVDKDLKGHKVQTRFDIYYHLIVKAIEDVSNCDIDDHRSATIFLRTLTTLADEMKKNGFWSIARDRVLVPLINLKNEWLKKDSRMASLIGIELDRLENL